MSITRAQQARQLYQFGGGADMGGVADSKGNVGASFGGGSEGQFSPPDDRGTPEQNRNQRAQVREGRIRAAENFIDRDLLGFTDAAKFNIAPGIVRLLQNLPQGGKPFDANRFPGGGGSSQAMATIPTWMQLGFSSEAEYLASLEDEEDKDKEAEEGLRLAFRADGGRIGLQEGGGIEQRLEQLGGDVTSAERILQDINQRLKTAESSLGSGGGIGGLKVPEGTIPTDTSAFKNISTNALAQPRPGAITPLLPDTGLANVTVPPPPPGTTFTPLPEDLMSGASSVQTPDPFFGSTGLAALSQRPLPESMQSKPQNLEQPQAVQQAFPGIPDSRPMGLAAADGTMSFMANPLSPQQQMEQANAEAGKLSPEERVQNAERSLTTRDMKTPQQLAYIDRVVKSGGMDYLFDLDYFTNSGLLAGGGGNSGIPALSPLNPTPDVYQRPPTAQRPFPMGQAIMPAAGYADGGNVVGGEFDFESARQMYGLGKLVKKVTRTVKKIAKSPVGKAAIAYGLFKGFKNPGVQKFLFGLPGGNPIVAPTKGILGVGGKFALGKGSLGVGTLIAGTSLAAGLLTAEQEQEAQELSRGQGIGIEAARNSILARAQGNIPGDLRATAFLAEGGKPEPVAKKTMPLLDMDGKEMDLRDNGGFVPIGRMEKADDVPARLSKNEFVFTADAVRNAGDGDVDKGAEVMYNMMKNLEAGGEVSEESQGLEGARKMFQTSQRLEEVL